MEISWGLATQSPATFQPLPPKPTTHLWSPQQNQGGRGRCRQWLWKTPTCACFPNLLQNCSAPCTGDNWFLQSPRPGTRWVSPQRGAVQTHHTPQTARKSPITSTHEYLTRSQSTGKRLHSPHSGAGVFYLKPSVFPHIKRGKLP